MPCHRAKPAAALSNAASARRIDGPADLASTTAIATSSVPFPFPFPFRRVAFHSFAAAVSSAALAASASPSASATAAQKTGAPRARSPFLNPRKLSLDRGKRSGGIEARGTSAGIHRGGEGEACSREGRSGATPSAATMSPSSSASSRMTHTLSPVRGRRSASGRCAASAMASASARSSEARSASESAKNGTPGSGPSNTPPPAAAAGAGASRRGRGGAARRRRGDARGPQGATATEARDAADAIGTRGGGAVTHPGARERATRGRGARCAVSAAPRRADAKRSDLRTGTAHESATASVKSRRFVVPNASEKTLLSSRSSLRPTKVTALRAKTRRHARESWQAIALGGGERAPRSDVSAREGQPRVLVQGVPGEGDL